MSTTPLLMEQFTGARQAIREHLGDWIDQLDGQGAGYAERYLEWLRTGSPLKQTPHAPAGMHPKIAAAIRDVAIDIAHEHQVPIGVRAR